jgi:hypothetical protein
VEFVAENDLEKSLMKAATEPEHRAQFTKDLLAAQIVLLDDRTPEQRAKNEGVIEPGTQLALRTIEFDSRPHIPIFTSPARLQAALNTSDAIAYLLVGARDFFEMARGADVLLNPGSGYGKQFTKEEIAAMLEGKNPQEHFEQITLEKNTQILLAQPKTYPTELTEKLSKLFEQSQEINAAYLCLIAFPDRPPHTLVALDCGNQFNFAPLQERVQEIVSSTTIPNPPVDFMDFNQPSTVTQYFKNGKIKPIYKKKKFPF